MDEKMIVGLITIGVIVVVAVVLTIVHTIAERQGQRVGYHDGYARGLEHGEALGKQRAYDVAYKEARSKTWTHIVMTGEDLKAYINGREVTAPPSWNKNIKSWGFWWMDGHMRDGFCSPGVLEADKVASVYAKDLNRLQRRIDL